MDAGGVLVETRELRCFVAVAEELHFGRAAVRLAVTQPGLSRTIRRLERRLGVVLLARTSRSVALTAAGATFLRDARTALDAVGAAVEHARRAAAPARRLVLAVKPGSDGGLLPALLAAYATRPGAVAVQIADTERRLAALRDGRADAALLHRPANDLTGLDSIDLAVERQVVVLPPGHALAGRAAVDLAEVRGEAVPRLPESAPDLPGPTIAADNVAEMLRLVAGGRGIAFLPESAIGQVPRALPCLPVSDAPPVALVLAWPRQRRIQELDGLIAAAQELATGTNQTNQTLPMRVE
jgi:DNA-binding transcriptional LysR family regulator